MVQKRSLSMVQKWLFSGKTGRFWLYLEKSFFFGKGASQRYNGEISKKIRYNGKNGLYHRTVPPCNPKMDGNKVTWGFCVRPYNQSPVFE